MSARLTSPERMSIKFKDVGELSSKSSSQNNVNPKSFRSSSSMPVSLNASEHVPIRLKKSLSVDAFPPVAEDKAWKDVLKDIGSVYSDAFKSVRIALGGRPALSIDDSFYGTINRLGEKNSISIVDKKTVRAPNQRLGKRPLSSGLSSVEEASTVPCSDAEDPVEGAVADKLPGHKRVRFSDEGGGSLVSQTIQLGTWWEEVQQSKVPDPELKKFGKTDLGAFSACLAVGVEVQISKPSFFGGRRRAGYLFSEDDGRSISWVESVPPFTAKRILSIFLQDVKALKHDTLQITFRHNFQTPKVTKMNFTCRNLQGISFDFFANAFIWLTQVQSACAKEPRS